MLGRAFQLIGQDKTVLYPAMIAEFIGIWLIRFFTGQQLQEQNIIPALLISGLLTFFIHLYIAECARQLILRKSLTIASALEVSLRRYMPVLFFSSLLPVPFLAVLFLLIGPSQVWLLMPLMFLLILILSMYPVVYVLSGVPAFRVYRAIWQYFCRKPWQVCRIFIYCLAITFGFAALISTLSELLPGNFSSVLVPLLSGVRTVLLVYGMVLFFVGDQKVSELV